MGKGISIDFVADVGKFLGGTKDVAKALDEVADSLDDLTQDAAKAGEAVGDELGDGARDAERSVDDLGRAAGRSLDDVGDEARDAGRKLGDEVGDGAEDAERAVDDLGRTAERSLEEIGDDAKDTGRKVGDEISDGTEEAEDAGQALERRFRDVFDTVRDDSRKTGDDVGDNVKRGTDKASEGVDHLKDESYDTAREVAASFDGSADSIADGFQEVAANAFAGFGPAAAAAGLGVAAAAGAMYNAWRENAEKTEKRIESMFEDMLESGRNYLSAEAVNTGIEAIIRGTEDATISMADAQKVATTTGLDLQTVVRAWSGDMASASIVQDTLNRKMDQATAAGSAEVWALREMDTSLGRVTTSIGVAADQADLYRSTVVTSAEASRDFAQAQATIGDTVTEATDAIAKNNTEITDGTQRNTANKAALAGLAGELVDYVDLARKAGVTGNDLNRVQRDAEQRFIDAAKAAGLTDTEIRDLTRTYGLVPNAVTTDIRADTSSAQGNVDRFIRDNDGRRVRLTVDVQQRLQQIPGTSQWIQAQQRASGGYIDGPGGPRDDRILARLSRGEYVLSADAVDRIGVGRLDQLNNGQTGPSRQIAPGPVDLSDTTTRRLIDGISQAVIAGASRITVAGIEEAARAADAAGRSLR